jgi:hypothetical protein
MSEIIYYMVHSDRQASADVLLPHWERLDIPIVVITPEAAPIKQTKHTHIAWGERGSDGNAMYARILYILEMFLVSQASHALLVEFDCLCLLDKIKFRNGLYGIPQTRPYDHLWKFMAARYVNPPYMLDRYSAMNILSIARKYPEVFEGGYADRLLPALAQLAHVPVIGFPEGSWSKTDWDMERLEAGMKESLREAIKSGCKWFHFIKTKEQLDFILAQT